MAWEWVSPLATVGGGALGAYFVWRAGKEGREHAETVSSQQLSHARQLAQDARKQQRLETAYVALLQMTERVGQWAHSVCPMLQTDPPREGAPMPSLEVQADAAAFLNAFASDEVTKRWDAWRDSINEVRYAVMDIELYRSGEVPREPGEPSPYKVLHIDVLPREIKLRKAIATQVALELSATPW
ncbi:hypothetical protein BST43_23395 [Mycobacteroides saopaulense]|uniref:Uncharacterized protein n=1 Tax=Mycobacteroides saopaulense TaxID=1578165 RepID=A0A1X0IMP0_9MYCO|nr:hypothetical protein [Mycobacteroides saopaulense]ORB49410.1 hypothetical protein BST43_23395 [Mycobacteroides saopaulense]